MGADLPKQFLHAGGKPLLLHTLERFHTFDPAAQILVTLPADWHNYWKDLLGDFECKIPHELIEGGQERFHSIQRALAHSTGEVVFIHDAVRPLVSEQTLHRCTEALETYGSAVPVLPIKESVRQLTNGGSQALRRDQLRIVQTPQCFRREMLKQAYQLSYHEGITDDASLVEEAGFSVHLIEGNEENIKVTTQQDLNWVDYLLRTE
jgi:2-C-methyl-D-erythritol 4-phosphate cytidylyltransferase